MKKFLLCLMLGASLASTAFGQGFYGVHSPNGTDVWAVGKAGRIFHSVDGGNTWALTAQGSKTLRSVFTSGQNVWAVGDSGAFVTSTNAGVTWTLRVLGDSVSALRTITFASASVGFAAGDAGKILKTTNGGGNWTALASGTTQSLNSLAFADASIGYAAGDAATLRKTTDAGLTWTNVAGSTWTKNLSSVSAKNSLVYVTGNDGFCVKSNTGGSSWMTLNFATQSASDVIGAAVINDTAAFFIGGGGYIRKTTNADSSYSWGQHGMHATLSSLYILNAQKGWAVSDKNDAVLRTTDGGATWQLPQGTTVSYTWTQKLTAGGGNVRGNSFDISSFNKNTIYCAMSTFVYASYNRGENWVQIGTLPTDNGGNMSHSFYVSRHDSNTWVAAQEANTDRIILTTNRGLNWTTTLARNFSSYGMPLELDPNDPNNMLYAPDGTNGSGADSYLYISRDFGATWDTLSHPNFRSPCDIVIFPGDSRTILLGDGVTGSGIGTISKSTDGGLTWSLVYSNPGSGGSEVPMIAVSAMDTRVGYATAWSSSGVKRTLDKGSNWAVVAPTGSAWGVDIAKDDPTVSVHGVYSGGTAYMTTNTGATFFTSSLAATNYGLLGYDRATFLAEQSNGIYKMAVSYTVPANVLQALTVSSPNGGESWLVGSTKNIAWSFIGLSTVKVEFRPTPDSAWQTVAASVPAANGSYPWVVPNVLTTQAKVRVSDVSGVPSDTSDAAFTITNIVATRPQIPAAPKEFALFQNYPNPFNPTTVIAFNLKDRGFASLKIYNTIGQEVKTLVSGVMASGRHEVQFNASALPSGVYFYRLKSGDFVSTKKMILVK